MRQDLERRARCVREVLGLGARSVCQVTSKLMLLQYFKSYRYVDCLCGVVVNFVYAVEYYSCLALSKFIKPFSALFYKLIT